MNLHTPHSAPSAFHTFFSFNPPKSHIRLLPLWYLFQRWEHPSLERRSHLSKVQLVLKPRSLKSKSTFFHLRNTACLSPVYTLSHILPHRVCCHFSSLGFSFCICKTGDAVQNTYHTPFQFLQYYSRKDFIILYTVQAGQPTHIYTYFGTYLISQLKSEAVETEKRWKKLQDPM